MLARQDAPTPWSSSIPRSSALGLAAEKHESGTVGGATPPDPCAPWAALDSVPVDSAAVRPGSDLGSRKEYRGARWDPGGRPDRPVTPEVAGSSPVARVPQFSVTCRNSRKKTRGTGNGFRSESRQSATLRNKTWQKGGSCLAATSAARDLKCSELGAPEVRCAAPREGCPRDP
jgi:hypothetical protein